MTNMKELIEKTCGEHLEHDDRIYIPSGAIAFSERAMRFSDAREAVGRGEIYCHVRRINDGFDKFVCYELTTCVEEGDNGDETGFGVEPDTWATAYVGDNGGILCRFCLNDEDSLTNAVAVIKKELDNRVPGDYSFLGGRITGYKGRRENGADLVLPAYIGGRMVSGIAPYAFSTCDFIRSVEIPDSIGRIDYCAFRGCAALESVRLPNKLNEISTSVFNGCSNLKTVTIPESVRIINAYAFSGCSSLEKVFIPRNVQEIKSDAFYCCPDIQSFTVDVNNEKYISDNGVVFSRDRRTLLLYPAAKPDTNYVIPQTVEKIACDVFTMCGSLESAVIPAGVKSIGALFIKCGKLKRVVVPSGVEIAPRTFEACNENLKVYIHSDKESRPNYPWGLRKDQIIWCGDK